MPVSEIARVLELPGSLAAQAVRAHWHEREQAVQAGRRTMSYVCGLLEGAETTVRGRMAASGPGLGGLMGCPYTMHHGAVTEDSDGPMELVRAMTDLPTAEQAALQLGDVQARLDPAHDELLVRLTLPEVSWPEPMPVLHGLGRRAHELGRAPLGSPRQVMISHWRTVTPDQAGVSPGPCWARRRTFGESPAPVTRSR